jgi:hypothetical protein
MNLCRLQHTQPQALCQWRRVLRESPRHSRRRDVRRHGWRLRDDLPPLRMNTAQAVILRAAAYRKHRWEGLTHTHWPAERLPISTRMACPAIVAAVAQRHQRWPAFACSSLALRTARTGAFIGASPAARRRLRRHRRSPDPTLPSGSTDSNDYLAARMTSRRRLIRLTRLRERKDLVDDGMYPPRVDERADLA